MYNNGMERSWVSDNCNLGKTKGFARRLQRHEQNTNTSSPLTTKTLEMIFDDLTLAVLRGGGNKDRHGYLLCFRDTYHVFSSMVARSGTLKGSF